MRASDHRERSSVLLRVLVADSGFSANDCLTALLSEFEGLSVFGCAQEPAKVLALVRAVRPDVVILDLAMEAAAGLRMVKKIKTRRPPPFVIVLAPYEIPALRRAASAAGADRLLVKTTECERLPEVLHELLLARGAHATAHACPPRVDQHRQIP